VLPFPATGRAQDGMSKKKVPFPVIDFSKLHIQGNASMDNYKPLLFVVAPFTLMLKTDETSL